MRKLLRVSAYILSILYSNYLWAAEKGEGLGALAAKRVVEEMNSEHYRAVDSSSLQQYENAREERLRSASEQQQSTQNNERESSLGKGSKSVTPGVYEFGMCVGFGGDSVPTTYRNLKYYDKYTCNKAYNEEDRCYVAIKSMERSMQEAGVLAKCGSFLNRELRECRKVVLIEGEKCAQLSK
ncbi:MAG: hypothetical protein HOO95_07720 [Gallionella sp.]|nr:hypothetical protein [Gallionella sp.]